MNSKRITIVTLTVASLAWTSGASAATKFWKDSIPVGAFSTSTNWSAVSAAGTDNGGAPVAGEPARIVHTNGVAHTVTVFGSTPSLEHLMIDLTGAGATTNTLTISNNVTLPAGHFFVGGHNGVSLTNGRGAVNQSNGSVTTPAGAALVVGYGAGSTGVYTLSGSGQFTAGDSEHIGYFGNGTFHHSGGTNTISGPGLLIVGSEAGGVGTYNLSGSGQLITNLSQYVADRGTGFFNQTGGTNTINGANNLILGNNAGSVGTYTISGTSTLTANNNVVVGNAGTGTLNIQGQSLVHIANDLAINGSSNVNLSGGTLRLNSVSSGLNRINYTGGKLQLGGDRTIGTDPIITAQFGSNPVIPSGKELAIEGETFITAGFIDVDGGKLSANFQNTGFSTRFDVTNGGTVNVGTFTRFNNDAQLTVDGPGSSITTSSDFVLGGDEAGSGYMTISGGGSVTAGHYAYVTGLGYVTVTGPGSTWTMERLQHRGWLTIEDRALVDVGLDGMAIEDDGIIYLNGGTLRTWEIAAHGAGQLIFNSGTIQLLGSRNIGSDEDITTYYGAAPVLRAGKGLGIEGTATLLAPMVIDGGTFSANQIVNGAYLTLQRGTLNITNQEVTIGSGGLLGTTLDLNDDMTVNVTQGITNQGLVTGDGQIGGPFINGVSGELRASAGQSLKLTGSTYSYGQIKLLGGELEFTEQISTAPGSLISGNGTIIARLGIFNQGVMNFAGTANIVGDVNNNAGGRIISGGGGATVFFDDVVNNAEIRTSANGFSVFFGSVSGSGTFTGTGTVNFEGDLKPGSSPAAISFGGDVSFGVDASLEIEIGGLTAGSQHDKLSIAGDLALDGELEVSLINGFNPSAGQSFNILDWGSLAGTFSSISLPTLAGLSWNTSQLYTTGVLSVAAAGLLGDFNLDGTVDAADYVKWRKGLGTTYTQDDYNTWRANFGMTAPGSGSLTNGYVPEPATFSLAALALVGGLLSLRRSGVSG